MDARRDDGPAMRLAIVEVLDRDGHPRQVVPVWQWPVSVGRAVDCDVVLDDPHVAARHATLADGDGHLVLEVGDTVNGAEVNARRVAAGQRIELSPGEVFQLGASRLRVRRAVDPLAPERALALEPAGTGQSLLVLALTLMAWSVGEQWVNTDPGGRLTDYLPVLIGSPALLAVWCGLWALVSKLFRHRFEFWPHVRVAITFLLLVGVAGLLLPLVAYGLSWSFPSRVTGLVGGALAWGMVLNHLTLVLPSHKRVLAMGMAIVFAGGVAVMLARNYQVNDRFFPELYVATLAPPATRLATAVTPERFLDESRRLKAVLDAHAKDDDSDVGEEE